MFASVPSAVLFGAKGHRVTVEVHVGKGLPAFHLVGLPDESIREARDRVRAAVCSSGFIFPDTRVTVNLAPSQHRKAGSALDLAIAMAVLIAGGEVPAEAAVGHAFVGELGLDGSIRSVPGMAPMVGAIGPRDVVVPIANQVEAEVVALGRVRLVANLRELVDALLGRAPWPDHRCEVGRAHRHVATRPGRRSRSTAGPRSPRDRRSRRPSPAPRRPAGLGEDHARQPASRAVATPVS
jgi:magnesium chelatase family protein